MASLPEVAGDRLSQVQFAVSAVRAAAEMAQRVQRELIVSTLSKSDRSPVTVADFAAQAVVAALLAEAFPDASLVGEESAAALRDPAQRELLEQVVRFVQGVLPHADAQRVCQWIDRGAGEPPASFWTLDPVDGTKGFLRREQYAVALAYVERGAVQVGVLGCPELDVACQPAAQGGGALLAATRGRGSFVAPLQETAVDADAWRPLRVSTVSTAADLRLLRSVEAGHTDGEGIGRLVEALGVQAAPVALDSQAKYAVLAAGGGEVVLRLLSPQRPDYRERIWDQAAGSILVEEAGGRVTDLNGKPLDFSHGRTLAANRGVLATNGPAHEIVLAGLRGLQGA